MAPAFDLSIHSSVLVRLTLRHMRLLSSHVFLETLGGVQSGGGVLKLQLRTLVGGPFCQMSFEGHRVPSCAPTMVPKWSRRGEGWDGALMEEGSQAASLVGGAEAWLHHGSEIADNSLLIPQIQDFCYEWTRPPLFCGRLSEQRQTLRWMVRGRKKQSEHVTSPYSPQPPNLPPWPLCALHLPLILPLTAWQVRACERLYFTNADYTQYSMVRL